MKLKFAAIGSNVLVAEEIKRAVQSIFYKDIDIESYTLDMLPAKKMADLYICATTQFEKLCQFVSPVKVVCLELMPSSRFFLSVGRIPRGERVYIWNNHLKYAQILEEYCQRLGILDIIFEPLPYANLSVDDVLFKLKQANYIMGVDCFIEGDLWENEKYRKSLQPSVVLIKAQRVASIQSASRLLREIAKLMGKAILLKRQKLQIRDRDEDEDAADHLLVYAEQAVALIRDSINKAVYNQISPEISRACVGQETDGQLQLKGTCFEEKLAGIDELHCVLSDLCDKLRLIEAGSE
jgi:hypothetical protein